jgi:hypothetical protein
MVQLMTDGNDCFIIRPAVLDVNSQHPAWSCLIELHEQARADAGHTRSL